MISKFSLPVSIAFAALLTLVLGTAPRLHAQTPNNEFAVVPFDFDPTHTFQISDQWIHGLGDIAVPGDLNDPQNDGLLLGKGTLTATDAASGARLVGLQPTTLTEIGWDIRNGSHCGAGAPRFNVTTIDGVTHFIGCMSPPPSSTIPIAPGWQRFRYNPALAFPPINSTVSSISIVFDEGTDTGGTPPFDGMGFAILHNIDVNGELVGH